MSKRAIVRLIEKHTAQTGEIVERVWVSKETERKLKALLDADHNGSNYFGETTYSLCEINDQIATFAALPIYDPDEMMIADFETIGITRILWQGIEREQ